MGIDIKGFPKTIVHWNQNGMRYGNLETSTTVFFTIPLEEVSHPPPFWDPRQAAALSRCFYWSIPAEYLQSFLEAAGQAESTEGGEYFTPVCIYKIFLQVTGSELASSRQGIKVCQHLKVEPQGALMLPWDKKWGKKINISLAPDCLLSFLPPHCKHFSLNRLYLLIF